MSTERVLIVSNDSTLVDLVRRPFKNAQFETAQTSAEALGLLENNQYRLLILDTPTTDPKLKYFDDPGATTSYVELLQVSRQLNPDCLCAVVTTKSNLEKGAFARKSGASIVLDRNQISLNQLAYLSELLKVPEYRTFLAIDLPAGSTPSTMVYAYLPLNGKYMPFVRPGETVTSEKSQKLKQLRVRHLFVKSEEAPRLFSSLKLTANQDFVSEQLYSIRDQYLRTIVNLFDNSSDGVVSVGTEVKQQFYEVIRRLRTLIERYPNVLHCLTELPFPRTSAIAHAFNLAIYTLVLGSLIGMPVELGSIEDLAFCALIANLGQSELDFSIQTIEEPALSDSQRIEYAKHPAHTIEVLKRKRIMVSPAMERTILQHHEKQDRSGFPEKLGIGEIQIEALFLGILGSFDHHYLLKLGEQPLTPMQAWQKARDMLTFPRSLVASIDQFFIALSGMEEL